MAVVDAPLAEAFRPRGADVVLAEHLDHAGAHLAEVDRDRRAPQSDHRENEVAQVFERVLGERHIAAGREYAQDDSEEQNEQQSKDKGWDRRPKQAAHVQQPVHPRATASGGGHSQRHRQQEGEQQGGDA